jgi:hypothetical protein
MPTYYNVTLGANIPHGSDILNRACSVTFTYPDGSHSQPYAGTVFAWPQQNSIRMSSAYANIDAAAQGMNGGTLSITAGGGPLAFPITAFAKMAGDEQAAAGDLPAGGDLTAGGDPASGGALVTAGAAPPITPIFGVVIELNGTPVPISSDSVDPTKGFSFTLPEPVDIGTPSDFLGWVDTTFGTDLKKTLDPSGLPTPIADLVSKLLNVDISVEQASINVPPKGSADSVTFTIALAATFPGAGIQLIPGSNVLTLKGGVAGATNQPPKAGGGS